MILKGTNTSYKHSHQKTHKSLAKHLTRSSVPDTIFSDKRQATSDKRQATSDKRQGGISAQSARINLQANTNETSQNNLGLVRGAASPLSTRLFVGGKRDTCQTQVSLFPPTAPYLLFNAAKGETPLETPFINRKAYKQRFPKSCGSLKKYTPYKFAFIASSKLKNVQGCTFLSGVFRGRAPKQTEKDGGAWGGRKTRSAGVSFLPKNRRGV